MSCDWNVYCRTCNDEHSFQDANHAEEAMHSLIRHAGAIAALSPLKAEKSYPGVTLTLGDPGYGSIDPAWFAEHIGHDLIPRDEYGKCSDQCGERWDCGSCSASHRCKLPAKHAGAHGQ